MSGKKTRLQLTISSIVGLFGIDSGISADEVAEMTGKDASNITTCVKTHLKDEVKIVYPEGSKKTMKTRGGLFFPVFKKDNRSNL